MWQFINRVAASRLGQALFVTHLSLLLFDSVNKPLLQRGAGDCLPQVAWDTDGILIAGRFFHWTLESTLMKTIALLDLPALLISSLLYAPVSLLYPSLCVEPASWIYAAVLLMCTSAQWWLIGYLFGLMFSKDVKPVSR